MLGDNILKLRKKSKLSQEELGNKIGVTRQTISNWELGETSPNPEQLKSLSKTLNISIDELLENEIDNIVTEKLNNNEKKLNTIYKLLIILLSLVICICSYYLGTFFGRLIYNF